MDCGNPGKEYENTRHNAGFLVIEKLAQKMDINVNKEKFNSYIGEGIYNGEKILLVKPQTYMNLSGEAVSQIANFYKVSLEDIIVIYDDIDIEIGNIRIRPSGSPGTHNGMRNITELIGSEQFARVRVGTGKVPEYMDLKDFVLMRFTNDEREILEISLKKSCDAIIEILNNGILSSMNMFNRKR